LITPAIERAKKTALNRKKLSTPMQLLNERGLLFGQCLDFGCGRGQDAERLGLEKYDPNWWPTKPLGFFDTITCNYVLYVLPPSYESEVIQQIQDLLLHNGIAYVSVRTDVDFDGYTSAGTYQRAVQLPLSIFYQGEHFATYMVRKHHLRGAATN